MWGDTAILSVSVRESEFDAGGDELAHFVSTRLSPHLETRMQDCGTSRGVAISSEVDVPHHVVGRDAFCRQEALITKYLLFVNR